MNVKILCLGALSRGPASGYEIRKLCEEGPFAHFYAAGFGSIYPALRSLRDDGLVAVEAGAEDDRGEKKIYRITDQGRARLVTALSVIPGPDRVRSDFSLVLFFASHLPADHVSRVLDHRQQQLEDAIKRMEAANCSEDAGTRFVRDLGLAIHRAELGFLKSNRHSLESSAISRSA